MTFDPEGNLWEVQYRPIWDGDILTTTQYFPATEGTGTLKDEDRLAIATKLMEIDPDLYVKATCFIIHEAYATALRTITQ